MSRIYREQVEIDSAKVRNFFDGRARKEASSLNAVMLQKEGSTLAQARDAHEKRQLLPPMPAHAKILELGCGAGRLAAHYPDASYLGIDFSEALIAKAIQTYAERTNAHFQVMALPELDIAALAVQSPYDLVLVTALFLYLNDDAVRRTLELMAQLASPSATIYIRESLSESSERLTLKEYFSADLNESYNAIYRSRSELLGMCDATLGRAGFTLSSSDYAFPPELRNREETAQFYFNFTREA